MEFPPGSEAECDALLSTPHAALDSLYPAVNAALSCDALIISGGAILAASERPWIAVTVHPVGTSGLGHPLIATLAASLRTIAKTAEAELVFLPHADFPPASGLVGDGALGEAIDRALYDNPRLRIQPVLPAAQTMWLTQQASPVISSGYHPLVFALAGAVPAMGIWTDEYTRKKLQGALIHAGRVSDAMSLKEALAGGFTAKALRRWHSRAWLREELRSRVATWRGHEEIRFAKLGYRLRAGMKESRDHEQELADLNNQLVSIKSRIDSAYSSRSWRLTAPLRWCDDIQRRVVKQLRRRLGGDY